MLIGEKSTDRLNEYLKLIQPNEDYITLFHHYISRSRRSSDHTSSVMRSEGWDCLCFGNEEMK